MENNLCAQMKKRNVLIISAEGICLVCDGNFLKLSEAC